ncbi:MAG: chorismate synthase [Bdellovibrionales bacterium]|jgi:chorismate synthase|nr:chorismate synthase [Bdellovibrionales bacterium]MBT3527444.1 chorismate synthase [Bdellovibrionales bacterium]MBT7767816.1 chorismate synthase [Bdellovibrionales bacterium]
MRGNTFGKMLSVTSFGESHGPAIGAVIDGVPANLPFDLSQLQKLLDRRAPGRIPGLSQRQEQDEALILSGIYQQRTLGTPIAVVTVNSDQRPKDYDALEQKMRPGHADKTSLDKYGIRDHRGGGRSSGRETIARVVGGYFASLVMPKLEVIAFASSIGKFSLGTDVKTADLNGDLGPYSFPDQELQQELESYLLELQQTGESVGGRINVLIKNTPCGLGEPVFSKLKADLAQAMLSIGGCTSFSYGWGEQMAELTGKEIVNRTPFGGMEGGISNGGRIKLQLTFKPPSTVGRAARDGRHDPVIVPRAVVVVESMARLVMADHFLRQNAYQL